MKSGIVNVIVSLVLMFLLIGCVAATTTGKKAEKRRILKISSTNSLYPFLRTDSFASQLFDKDRAKNSHALSAIINEPDKYHLKFNGNTARTIGDFDLYEFKEGLYPFTIYWDLKSKTNTKLSGAMVVNNIDDATALALFGKSKETILFNPEMITKAKNGILTSGSIEFDGKKVISYWIGNRKKSCIGDARTVEVNFVKTPQIKTLWVNGKKYDDFCVTLVTDKNKKNPKKNPQKISHKLKIALKNGLQYKGYIRTQITNEFTTFMSLNCEIPADLFEAADRGTISNYKVNTPKPEEDNETIGVASEVSKELVEIVFGTDR